MEVAQYVEGIRKIIVSGGPEPSEYDYLTKACESFMEQGLSLEDELGLYDEVKPLLSMDSMIGFSFLKPYGYSGDFELIDRIYQKWTSSKSTINRKWDDYYHDLQAARAVRNRKEYLKGQLSKVLQRSTSPRVLNLASGPCTDLFEYFMTRKSNPIKFDCLDLDSEAIDYASVVCDNFIDDVEFINTNAFRYTTDKKYDLIWSAGLFDYFSDKLFIRLTNRMYGLLAEGGELVVGNFSTNNPSRGLMEVMLKWFLHHRSEEDLINLAKKAGVPEEKIEVNAEETGVNLFLHMKK